MSIHKLGELRTKLTALDLAKRLYQALDTPLSLSCYLLAKYGEYEQLVTKSIEPLWYLHPARFFCDYQAVKLLSKFPHLNTGIDRELAAKKKFIEAEVLCAETNIRFSNFRSSGDTSPFSASVGRVLWRAQQKISNVLGDVPSYEELEFRFGPGAAFGVRGETSVYNKVSSTLECTFAMLPILGDFLAEFPGWIKSDTAEVQPRNGSQLTFVPKDAKTERPICIEPLLNGLYQKGAGTYIRSRLKRHGVNLDDQSINQKLARRAYFDQLSTVDFSSASDTIAHNLVLDLLPFPWFEFLDVARCPQYLIEGHWYNFHKFTSMGNAYTFELETLLFYSLACACCEELDIPYQTGENLHVYGDDVIIPRGAFDLFAEVSRHCGFLPNQKKSYKSGEFFESCGHDYFKGYFVRPFLIKKEFTTIEDAYYATNQVLETISKIERLPSEFDDCHDRDGLIHRLHDVHSWCISGIPRGLRLLVPYGQGDCGLHSDFDVACPPKHKTWCGYMYVAFRRRALKYKPVDGFPTAYALYFAGLGTWGGAGEPPEPLDNGSGYTIRNRTKLVKVKQFLFGPWPLLSVQWSSRSLSMVART